MTQALPQRLAVVLAADAVGFSKSMADDDQGTVAALEDARAIFRDRVQHCGGRVVDTAGDSVLCVFESAASAVRAAVEVQERLRGPAGSNPPPLQFRIGLHLGDVIFQADGSIYGDGVNVAARLQSLAPAGAVLVSAAVRGALRSDLAATLSDFGVHQLKNFALPVHAYLLQPDGQPSRRALAKGASATAVDAFSVSLPIQGFGGRPAIAVLPFDNLSSDPDQAFIADGIAEDILTRLAMWRHIPVIARNSSFAFRGRVADLKQVGAALGARYILEGSVRKSAGRMRISGQLIDAETGHHVWAARYDRVLAELFELQDEISGAIVAALEPAVGVAERNRSQQRPVHDLGAWELYQRGCWHFAQLTGPDLAECKRLCQAAAQQDPTFGVPLGLAAFSNAVATLFGWADPVTSLRESIDLASSAMARDPLDPSVLAFHGTVCAFAGRLDTAVSSCKTSLQYNPSSALAHFGLGYACVLRGEFETSRASCELALRLSPSDFLMPIMLGIASACHYFSRDYEAARQVGEVAVDRAPGFPMSHAVLARALAQLGRKEEALASLQNMLALAPGYTTETAHRALPFQNAAHFEHWMEGLRILGWQG